MLSARAAREFIASLRRYDFGRKVLAAAELPAEFTDDQAIAAARLAADAMKRESVRRTMDTRMN